MMRQFAVIILLLFVLGISVEAFKIKIGKKMIPICSNMFKKHDVADRQCKTACLLKKHCTRGYCKVTENRPQCLCFDCPGHKRKGKKKKLRSTSEPPKS